MAACCAECDYILDVLLVAITDLAAASGYIQN